jgi:hypothetical protein
LDKQNEAGENEIISGSTGEGLNDPNIKNMIMGTINAPDKQTL